MTLLVNRDDLLHECDAVEPPRFTEDIGARRRFEGRAGGTALASAGAIFARQGFPQSSTAAKSEQLSSGPSFPNSGLCALVPRL